MDVGMGTEIVIMLPQAGELAARSYWQPPETGKKPGRAPPRSLQRKHHPLTLDFRLPASGTTLELIFVVLRHQLSGNFFFSLRKPIFGKECSLKHLISSVHKLFQRGNRPCSQTSFP